MVKYADLKRTHADYDPIAIEKECLLYKGGNEIKQNAHLFLTKLHMESQDTYNERLQHAAYIPYLGKFIDYFVASLFSQDVQVVEMTDEGEQSSVDPFYNELAADADMAGSSFQSFLQDLFTDALIHGVAYVGVDFPKVNELPANAAQQRELGQLRAYLYEVDNTSIVDYMCDPNSGEYVWLKLRSDLPYQPTPFDEPMHQIQFKCWQMVNGQAEYEVYLTNPLKIGEEPKDTDEIPTVDQGRTSFACIPILCMTIPDGLAIGAKLSPLAEEHFQRRSVENMATNKACITIPVIKKQSTIPEAGGSVPPVLDRMRGNDPSGKFNSQGWVELNEKDALEIVEAEGKALQFIHKQNEDLVEQMHSIIHQMAQHIGRNQNAQSRSAQSKIEDRHATEIMLTAFAEVVTDTAISIYNLITETRGEEIDWTVRGLSTTEFTDREQLLKEALNVQNINIPSPLFKVRYQYNLAAQLLGNISEEEERQLLAELQSAGAMAQPMQDANDNPVNPENSTSNLGQTLKNKFGGDSHDNPNHAGSEPPSEGSEQLVNEQGVMNGFEGMHLAEAEHTHWSEVQKLLADDYDEKDLEWLKMIPWKGPVAVPISSLDLSEADMWRASQPGEDGQEKVHRFAQRMAETGQWKPVILINEPHSNKKMWPVDGRHRILAAKEVGQDVMAYVGEVGEITEDHPGVQLHAKQNSYKNSSIIEPTPMSGDPDAPKVKEKAGKDNPNQVSLSRRDKMSKQNGSPGDFKV